MLLIKKKHSNCIGKKRMKIFFSNTNQRECKIGFVFTLEVKDVCDVISGVIKGFPRNVGGSGGNPINPEENRSDGKLR